MDIAFSAERSIQDGIEEISSAEVGTVLVSYLIMFLYVALALGKIKSLGKALVSERYIQCGPGAPDGDSANHQLTCSSLLA